MCKIRRIYDPLSISKKQWLRIYVIDLKNPFDPAAARQIVRSKIFPGIAVVKGSLGPFYTYKSVREMQEILNGRSCQLKSYSNKERGKRAPKFKNFLIKFLDKTEGRAHS
jgi:hypothetical protein